ncbi:GNAT family N-acetyltransferase [Ferrimonas balearica]|uniref:GNAT family N-acetyltransferase n=1 Tax=Ferrimonas balearica TaxID=44012 RepID=UPI001C9A0A7B|nr:GNAT family N-acetyltransferase [Ferrimonas balearica]MBY5993900.1 GNAT family N-acetyltransferase [Ferrimonas balearica]
MAEPLRHRTLSTLADIAPAQWDPLLGGGLFTGHRFLHTLEATGCVGGRSGWHPHHQLVYRGEHLVAALPLYLKQHSYGEYLFDWSWARAYQSHGLAYYPKLVSAVPYTPVSGPRLGVAPDEDEGAIMASMAVHLEGECARLGASGVQWLFCPAEQANAMTEQGWYRRRDVHFQWINRGDADMAAYLARFKARKRKMVRKERERVRQAGVTVEVLEGAEIPPELWRRFYLCYHHTYLKRTGQGGYLTEAFFTALAQHLTPHLVMMVARRGDAVVASALYLKAGDTLYGRYWGALEEIHGLHFELCYYQGIEYCLRHRLARFDPGVQGEHKLARGFEPVFTYGCGQVSHPEFAPAIHRFCRDEWAALAPYHAEARSRLPFKTD